MQMRKEILLTGSAPSLPPLVLGRSLADTNAPRGPRPPQGGGQVPKCVSFSPLWGPLRSRASHRSQAMSGPCSVLEDSSKLRKMKKEQRKGGRKEKK